MNEIKGLLKSKTLATNCTQLARKKNSVKLNFTGP